MMKECPLSYTGAEQRHVRELEEPWAVNLITVRERSNTVKLTHNIENHTEDKALGIQATEISYPRDRR